MRRKYETQADRNRELKAGLKFANAMDAEIQKLSPMFAADFLVLRDGNPIGYIEVKTRTCNSTTYTTYHLSKMKLTALNRLAFKDGLKAAVVVQWADRAGFISVDKFLTNATYVTGGRWDRNDRADVEQMADVDISLFTFLD